jgi:hypothetical protein
VQRASGGFGIGERITLDGDPRAKLLGALGPVRPKLHNYRRPSRITIDAVLYGGL